MEQSLRKSIPWRWVTQVLLVVVADPNSKALVPFIVWFSKCQSPRSLIPTESSWKTTRFPWQSPECTPGAGAELSPRPEPWLPALNCVTRVPRAKVSPAATSGLSTKLGRSQEISSPFPGKGSRSFQLVQSLCTCGSRAGNTWLSWLSPRHGDGHKSTLCHSGRSSGRLGWEGLCWDWCVYTLRWEL